MSRGLMAGVMVLALAGCGGGDAGSGDGGATTVTTTTVPQPTPAEWAAAVCAARPVPGRERVNAPALAEVSGLATVASGLWAHNDSGDEARVYRLGPSGRTAAVVGLQGITAVDWEDMAGAGSDTDELFVGDIGDNAGVRSELTVQRLSLPSSPVRGEVSIPASEVQTITLLYPDGPRDAETLLVDPVTRDLVVVHKRFGGASEVYQAPEADWSDGEAVLQRVGIVEVGDTALDAATGGDVGYDGQVVALRTYAAILVFAREDDQSLAQALVENEACDAPTAIEVQGEALAFTPEGYVTVSEGERPPINRFAVTDPLPGE